MVDPEVLDKIKRACSPQKAIYDMAEYMGGYDADIIGAVDTANKASQDASAALSTVNTVKATADNALSTANKASSDAANAASTASAAQTAAANAQTTADSALAGANAAVNGLDVTSDQSTVSVTATKNTGSPDVNSLPVASAASAGVMNSATFLAVEGLNSRVAALENEIRTYLVVLPNTTPTQTEITTAYRSAYPGAPNPPLDGTVVIDAEKDLYYQWVGGSSQWIKLSGQQIGMFTNSTLGTIKGSTTEGQIAAEPDGTGSLNGYDALKSGVAANTTALGTLTTRVTTAEGKIDTNTSGIAANKVNADKAINNIVVNQGVPSIEIVADKNDGTTINHLISPVSASQAGIVTPEMYNQWNAGGNSKVKIELESNTNMTQGLQIYRPNNALYRFRIIPNGNGFQLKADVAAPGINFFTYLDSNFGYHHPRMPTEPNTPLDLPGLSSSGNFRAEFIFQNLDINGVDLEIGHSTVFFNIEPATLIVIRRLYPI